MSREIKFRVFSKKLNKYVGGMLIDQKSYLYSKQLGFEIDEENNLDYVIEQYTGLKDKNGKEICEGDIVEDTMWTRWEVVSHPTWHRLVIAINGRGWLDFGDEGASPTQLEVVGNIHEKELL